MNFSSIANQISKVAKLKKISEEEIEIVTEAKIDNSTPIKMYLRKSGNNVVMCDKKHTLKYMNTYYELKSADVKNCIAAVVKIYGFSIVSGELITPIAEKTALETFYSFIICVGQLANMYAFFDKP